LTGLPAGLFAALFIGFAAGLVLMDFCAGLALTLSWAFATGLGARFAGLAAGLDLLGAGAGLDCVFTGTGTFAGALGVGFAGTAAALTGAATGLALFFADSSGAAFLTVA